MLTSSIGRLRIMGILEGLSFLLLLFVAMPLKYAFGKPEMVSVVGMSHGILFLLYLLLAMLAMLDHGWGMKRLATVGFAAVFPFGPFIIEPSLKREQQAAEGGQTVPADATND